MNKKIAIVDDDVSILEAVQIVFQMEGYDVLTNTNGQDAVRKIPEFNPQVVLLDVLLSGEDGRDIVRKLKSSGITQQIPVIMFSANPNVEESALAAGADAFLAKLFDINKLIELAEKCAESRSNEETH